VILLAHHHGVDLETEVARKWLAWKPKDVVTEQEGLGSAG
jgi:hypothetical protein